MIKTPVLFNKKEECCGCTACYSVCIKKAIHMTEDDEGFVYPLIEDTLCIGCGRCLSICPIKKIKRNAE